MTKEAACGETYMTESRLWLWSSGKTAGVWHFLTIEGEVADAIRLSALMVQGRRRGFGSVRVAAQIGDSRWQTSIFPHKESGGWILPVKLAVRRAEGIAAGDMVAVHLTI